MAKMTSSLVNEELVVIVHSKEHPDDTEWDDYLGIVRSYLQKSGVLPRVLVYSAGGGPQPAQRKRAVALVQGLKSHVALITSRPFPRGVAAMASFFGINIRAFASIRNFDAVAEYLLLGEQTKRGAQRELARMAEQLGVALE
jgi:hypothetical protein